MVANPAQGLAPLAVTFTVTNPTSVDATFMFDTFGPFGLPAGSSVQLSLGYPAGVFAPAIVITAGASTYTHYAVVESRDPAVLDQMLRAIWSGLNNAACRRQDGALRTAERRSAAQFGPVFDVLMPFMGRSSLPIRRLPSRRSPRTSANTR